MAASRTETAGGAVRRGRALDPTDSPRTLPAANAVEAMQDAEWKLTRLLFCADYSRRTCKAQSQALNSRVQALKDGKLNLQPNNYLYSRRNIGFFARASETHGRVTKPIFFWYRPNPNILNHVSCDCHCCEIHNRQ